MPIHFERREFDDRQARAAAALRETGLDAILLFAPESHLWLTGYDTFGFAMFQTMVLSADGGIHLMTPSSSSLPPSIRSHLLEVSFAD